jgi:hypothetical protein
LDRGSVSIDVLIGYVRDRVTGVVIPEEWISSRPRQMRLLLITGSTHTPVRVCRPEALWVLKLVAGRNQDLGDLFAISAEPVNFAEVREFLASLSNPALQERLTEEEHRLSTDRILKEALGARFTGSSTDTARQSWERFKLQFHELTH